MAMTVYVVESNMDMYYNRLNLLMSSPIEQSVLNVPDKLGNIRLGLFINNDSCVTHRCTYIVMPAYCNNSKQNIDILR